MGLFLHLAVADNKTSTCIQLIFGCHSKDWFRPLDQSVSLPFGNQDRSNYFFSGSLLQQGSSKVAEDCLLETLSV
jgi:hypothetical protein